MPAAAVEHAAEGDESLVAGWPIDRQYPRGEETVFVTVEDETGGAHLILWPRVFRWSRRQLGNHVLLARGTVSRWDGTASVVASDVHGVHPRVLMSAAHDWR